MGALDFLRKHELEQINNLNEEVALLKRQLAEKESSYNYIYERNKTLEEDLNCKTNELTLLTNENESLKKECKELCKYKTLLDLEKEKDRILSEIEIGKETFNSEQKKHNEYISNKRNEIERLDKEISEKKNQIIELDDTILLQEFGIYKPIFDFANSEIYKENLYAIREEQKNLIREERAAFCKKEWTVDGSVSKGKIFTKRNVKQIIRSFNNECDILVSKVKFNGIIHFNLV